MSAETPFIVIGSRGTALLKGVKTLPHGVSLGSQEYRCNRSRPTQLDCLLEAWVIAPGEPLIVLDRVEAVRSGRIKEIPVTWEHCGQRFDGTAYVDRHWRERDGWPDYVAADCPDWPEGVVETVSQKGRNRHRLATPTIREKQEEKGYWMTTHWPYWEDEDPTQSREGIFVPDGKQRVLEGMKPGDRAFIYESKEGRPRIRKLASGGTETIKCTTGAGGIVALVEVTGEPEEIADSERHEYSDGSSAWWRFKAPTKSINSMGFVDRVTAAKILGYKEKYVFKGFGDANSGVKRITKAQYDDLHRLYLLSAKQTEEARLQASTAGHGFGGEGAEHLALKMKIAADPASVLGEPKLKHIETEYPFKCTGDRIDVLLMDSDGRHVAVEVEVDCSADEKAGPLQCMKYRAMLSYALGRPAEEIRTILVAHSIDATLRDRCLAYRIETCVVPRMESLVR